MSVIKWEDKREDHTYWQGRVASVLFFEAKFVGLSGKGVPRWELRYRHENKLWVLPVGSLTTAKKYAESLRTASSKPAQPLLETGER